MPVPGLIIDMSYQLLLQLRRTTGRRQRHGERAPAVHPLDLAGATVLGPGLYRIPAVAEGRALRSASPCHAAQTHVGWRRLYSLPETRVRCRQCRRRWTVSQHGPEHMLWAG
ncbi:MAG: hypothetical protein ACRDYX_10980 [Egibacteraceae bacterium]